MKKRRLVWIAAIAAAAVSMTGCAASSAAGDGSSDAAGGTLTYLEPQAWITLYPPAGGFYPNGGVINQITDRLLYQNPETLELEPWIAAELPEVNADATEYTFTLRDGVTYSDGSALDAANVLKNIELYATGDPDRALTVSEAINNYDHGEVIDEQTVKFFFSAPSPGFGQAVSTINSGLLSSDTLDRTSEEFGPGNATEIIGSGPFVVSDEQIGTELNLETRADYDWAAPSRDHQGPAQIAGVDLIVAPEASVRVGTVVSGQADIARTIPAPDEAQFDAPGLGLFAAATNGVNNGLNLRFGYGPLADLSVRQAVIAGIDREAIVETLFSKSYPLATGVLAQDALGYTDTSANYVYDPALAKQLLDEAGWVPGADGIRAKEGEQLVLTFNDALPQPRSKEVVTLIQEQLAEIGIRVELLPGDQVTQDTTQRDPNAIQVFHSMVGRADFDVLKSQYFSANRDALVNLNPETGELNDAELESLLAQIASSPDAAGRQAASAAAQQRIAEQAYVLPLFEEPQVYGLRDSVRGFATESIGRPSFYEVTLEK